MKPQFKNYNSKGNTAQFKAHGLLEYYSVSLPKKSRQGVSLTLIYLYNLTKNLAAQSAHLNDAVLPKDYEAVCDFLIELNRARSLGAKKAYVLSDMPFYEKLGFRKDKHFTFYWKK